MEPRQIIKKWRHFTVDFYSSKFTYIFWLSITLDSAEVLLKCGAQSTFWKYNKHFQGHNDKVVLRYCTPSIVALGGNVLNKPFWCHSDDQNQIRLMMLKSAQWKPEQFRNLTLILWQGKCLKLSSATAVMCMDSAILLQLTISMNHCRWWTNTHTNCKRGKLMRHQILDVSWDKWCMLLESISGCTASVCNSMYRPITVTELTRWKSQFRSTPKISDYWNYRKWLVFHQPVGG